MVCFKWGILFVNDKIKWFYILLKISIQLGFESAVKYHSRTLADRKGYGFSQKIKTAEQRGEPSLIFWRQIDMGQEMDNCFTFKNVSF